MTNVSGCPAEINAELGATVPVRVICGLTVGVCTWALANMRRCRKRMELVATLAVSHVLLVHVIGAMCTIVGVSVRRLIFFIFYFFYFKTRCSPLLASR